MNEKKAQGTYEVKLDASGLATGVYLYRLFAGSFVQTRKVDFCRDYGQRGEQPIIQLCPPFCFHGNVTTIRVL